MKSLAKYIAPLSVLAFAAPAVHSAALISAGGVEVFVTGTAALDYEDNLFRRTTNKVSDYAWRLTPGLELVLGNANSAELKLAYRHRFVYYDKNGNLDNDYSDLDFRASINTGIFLGSAHFSFRELANNSRNELDVNLPTALIRRDEIRTGANGRYQVSQLTSLGLGVDYSDVDFKNPGLTSYTTSSIPVTLFYKVRPRADMTLGYRYRNTDIQGFTGPSVTAYKDHYVFTGIVGELGTPKFLGDVSVGYQERSSELLGTKDGNLSYNVVVTYAASANSNYYVRIANDFATSGASGISYNLGTLSVGGSLALSRVLSTNFSATYGKADYRNSAREESQVFFNAGLSYSPNQYISVRVNYGHEDIDAKSAASVAAGGSNFKSNRISVSASVRY
jgi:hypothetical protein